MTAIVFGGGKFYVGDIAGGVTQWALGDIQENSNDVEPGAFERELTREADGHLSRIVGLFHVEPDNSGHLISVDERGLIIRWR